jgi:hypothetical protein
MGIGISFTDGVPFYAAQTRYSTDASTARPKMGRALIGPLLWAPVRRELPSVSPGALVRLVAATCTRRQAELQGWLALAVVAGNGRVVAVGRALPVAAQRHLQVSDGTHGQLELDAMAARTADRVQYRVRRDLLERDAREIGEEGIHVCTI